MEITAPNCPAVQTFTNVALYLRSGFMGNILRVDCKTVTITPGQKYAQYDNATRVEFLEKGKRKSRGLMLTYHPFAVILPSDRAIEPDSMYLPAEETPTATIRQGRYGSCDEGWVRDFVAKLAASHATPVFAVGLPGTHHIGKFARSIEAGWLGKVVGVEMRDGLTLLRMKGVDTLAHAMVGGDVNDCLADNDIQWFTPEDVKFLETR